MEFLAYFVLFTLAGAIVHGIFSIGVFYGEEKMLEEIYGKSKQTAP